MTKTFGIKSAVLYCDIPCGFVLFTYNIYIEHQIKPFITSAIYYDMCC